MVSTLAPPKELFTEEFYPKVYSWRNRFKEALEAAKSTAPKPVTLEGSDAVSAVLAADFSDKDLIVDANDPLQLKAGVEVKVFPTDGGGYSHRDEGRLVKLTKDEVAIAVQSEQGAKEVHIHAPRWHFRVSSVGGASL